MFGWEPGEATIVRRVEHMAGAGLILHDYVVEVRPDAGGEPFRAQMGDPRVMSDFTAPSEGDVVRVHANRKKQRARFAHGNSATSLKRLERRQRAERQAELDEALAEPPTGR